MVTVIDKQSPLNLMGGLMGGFAKGRQQGIENRQNQQQMDWTKQYQQRALQQGADQLTQQKEYHKGILGHYTTADRLAADKAKTDQEGQALQDQLSWLEVARNTDPNTPARYLAVSVLKTKWNVDFSPVEPRQISDENKLRAAMGLIDAGAYDAGFSIMGGLYPETGLSPQQAVTMAPDAAAQGALGGTETKASAAKKQIAAAQEKQLTPAQRWTNYREYAVASVKELDKQIVALTKELQGSYLPETEFLNQSVSQFTPGNLFPGGESPYPAAKINADDYALSTSGAHRELFPEGSGFGTKGYFPSTKLLELDRKKKERDWLVNMDMLALRHGGTLPPELKEAVLQRTLDMPGNYPGKMKDRDFEKWLKEQIEAAGTTEQANGESGKGKTLTAAVARSYLDKAGGDKAKARTMAMADGYTIPEQ